MTDKPLISCLLPTYNRRRFFPLGLESFLHQSYPNLELVVVDDGNDKIADLLSKKEHILAAADRIRYVALDSKISLGAKWNVCIGLARGEIVTFWSDDDWRHPKLVETLYRTMQTADEKAVAAGLAEAAFVDLFSGDRWIFCPETPCDIAFMFLKEVWRKGAFYDFDGSDSINGFGGGVFQKAIPFVERNGLRAKDLLVGTRHNANSWGGHFDTQFSAYWRRDPDPCKLPSFLKNLVFDPEVGVRPPRKDRHTVSFKVTGFSGLDGFLHSVLPARMFARRVARKLIGPDGLYHGWDFSDDTGELIVETGEGAFRVVNSRGDVVLASGLGVPVC